MSETVLSSRARYPVAAFFFSLFLGFVRICPWGVFRLFVFGVVRVLYLCSPRLRRNALESLGIAFGEGMDIQEKKRLSALSFRNLAEGIAWFIYSMDHPEITAGSFFWQNRELLDQALASGKGAVIAVAHFGPFVWMMRHFADEGYPANIVMRPPRSPFLKLRFLEDYKKLRMNFIYSVPIRSCVADSFAALRRGELVFMPIDQNYGGLGRVFVDFFGRKAATAPGVVGYGQRTGAPVFFVFCLPKEGGRFRIVIEPVPESLETGETRALEQRTAFLTSRLERLIRQYPGQWSWMHRRWKTVPRPGELAKEE